MRTVLQGGVVVRPDGVFAADISFENGQILEMGKPDTLFNSPRHPRLRQFLTQIL